MKSFFLALILGITIFAGGMLLSNKINTITSSIGEKNKQLYSALELKDQKIAKDTLHEAEKEFKKYKVLLEATSDHEELLRIELEYAAIGEFISEDQFGDALASCSEIELLINHLPSNFEIKAENIL